MEGDMAVSLIDTEVYGFPSVTNCIVSVVQHGGLTGLKKWLGAVKLYNKKDRTFLRRQIKILSNGTNELFPNLKKLCRYKGESDALVKELFSYTDPH